MRMLNHVLFLPDGILISLKSTYWLMSGSYFLRVNFLSVLLNAESGTWWACCRRRSSRFLLSSADGIALASLLPWLYFNGHNNSTHDCISTRRGSALAGAEEVHVLELQLRLFDVHLLHHLLLDFLLGLDLDHVVALKAPALGCAF